MLSPSNRAVVVALSDTLFPPEPDAPGGSTIIPEALEDLMSGMDSENAKELVLGLQILEFGAVPLFRGRFSRLPAAQRDRYLRGWMTSRIPFRRTLYRGIRGLFMNLYYADERTWPLMGYAGPPLCRPEAPPITERNPKKTHAKTTKATSPKTKKKKEDNA